MALPTYEDLQKMTDGEVIDKYNAFAQATQVGTGFWLDEMVRRRSERATLRMEKMMKTTIVVAIVSVLVSAASVLVSALGKN